MSIKSSFLHDSGKPQDASVRLTENIRAWQNKVEDNVGVI